MLPNLPTTAVVPGSWAYGPRGQPNEEADCDSSCRCQEDSNDEKDSRSHARALLPAALASVSFGFVLVRVRVGLSRALKGILCEAQADSLCSFKRGARNMTTMASCLFVTKSVPPREAQKMATMKRSLTGVT